MTLKVNIKKPFQLLAGHFGCFYRGKLLRDQGWTHQCSLCHKTGGFGELCKARMSLKQQISLRFFRFFEVKGGLCIHSKPVWLGLYVGCDSWLGYGHAHGEGDNMDSLIQQICQKMKIQNWKLKQNHRHGCGMRMMRCLSTRI